MREVNHERNESSAADTFPGRMHSFSRRQRKSTDAALLLKGVTHVELFLFSYFSPLTKKKKKRPDHGEKFFTTAALTSAFALERQKKKNDIVHFCFFFLFCFRRSEQASVTRAAAAAASARMETSQVQSVKSGFRRRSRGLHGFLFARRCDSMPVKRRQTNKDAWLRARASPGSAQEPTGERRHRRWTGRQRLRWREGTP